MRYEKICILFLYAMFKVQSLKYTNFLLKYPFEIKGSFIKSVTISLGITKLRQNSII